MHGEGPCEYVCGCVYLCMGLVYVSMCVGMCAYAQAWRDDEEYLG